MGLFNKDEKIPAIPVAPMLPKIPVQDNPEKKEMSDLPELPSFPATSRNENLNQEIVKSAVTDMPSPGEEEVHVDVPEDVHVVEVPQSEGAIPPKPLIPHDSLPPLSPVSPPTPLVTEPKSHASPMMPEPPKHIKPKPMFPATQKPMNLSPPPANKPEPKEAEPIFVRIDRFQAAQKNFEQIKEKVEEIESVLKRLKDVKSQEEVELKGWTEDVEKIKSKLSELDQGIFNQI